MIDNDGIWPIHTMEKVEKVILIEDRRQKRSNVDFKLSDCQSIKLQDLSTYPRNNKELQDWIS